jgi:hypothetical protein
MAADSDEAAAVASRRKALNLVSSNQWWVGGAHLPFPGLGHLRRDPDRYTWVPVTFHAGRSEQARKTCRNTRPPVRLR